MFKILEDSIDNALGVVGGLVVGEVPDRSSVAKLIADGMTVAAVAAACGVAEDVIADLIEQEGADSA